MVCLSGVAALPGFLSYAVGLSLERSLVWRARSNFASTSPWESSRAIERAPRVSGRYPWRRLCCEMKLKLTAGLGFSEVDTIVTNAVLDISG